MAHLVAIQTSSGEWQAFVVAHPSNRFAGDIDVTGRKVPFLLPPCGAWDGVPKAGAERLARSLRGVPKAARRAAILKASEGLRLSASAGGEILIRRSASVPPLSPAPPAKPSAAVPSGR
ncbi:MAG: hypothetical protein KL785_08745 [Brevundimonas sp.]|nr:hypothetical protein [Brevundimonas sp.]